ncbi:MAG: endonuclease domain-containing protein [Candidatus Margulisiibacteriota bacterium]
MKQIKKEFSRTLRKDLTKAERFFWEVVRERKLFNLKFRRQHVIKGFILDFYCHEILLGIEIDGSIHNKQKEYDQERQAIIESMGVAIFRYTNKEILSDKATFRKRLKCDLFSYIKAFQDKPPPLPPGEGRQR